LSPKIIFRVDGGSSPDIGMGHIYRSCLIADNLKNKFQILFLTSDSIEFLAGAKEIIKRGYELRFIKDVYSAKVLIQEFSPDIAIIDLYHYKEEDLINFHEHGSMIFTFDHFNQTRKYSNYCINPCKINGQYRYDGLEFAILPPPLRIEKNNTPKVITLSFGGFDNGAITKRLLSVSKKIIGNIELQFITGPNSINDLVGLNYDHSDNRIRVHQNPSDFNKLIAYSDIAVVAGGVTLLQCISEGIPTISIAQYEHQSELAIKISNLNGCKFLGMHSEVSDHTIVSAINELIQNQTLREEYNQISLRLIDGNGLDRLMKLINTAIKEFK